MASKNAKKVYKRSNKDLLRTLRSMQRKRFNIFHKQDLENGRFDVTFEIKGKQLHAHKFILTSISEPLDSWLSDRWTTKDEVVKIETYSYKHFYQFLRFLYTGSCFLTKHNIFKITDMAEFYAVQGLKNFCDKFLAASKKSVGKIEELYDVAEKYSLSELKKSVGFFFCHHVKKVCNSEVFITFKKPFVEFLFTVGSYEYNKETGFKAVYKWAEHRVLQDQAVDGDRNFNLQEAIKVEFSTFLPKFNFSKMKFDFLMDFVVEKGFCLSPGVLFQYFMSYVEGGINYGYNSSFERTYKLAQKLAFKKQEMFPEENFILRDSINALLVDVWPNVEFSKMDKVFLTDFIIGNEIISEEQAEHIFDTKVEIKNNGKAVTGVFNGNHLRIDLFRENPPSAKQITRKSTTKIRFLKLKFKIPTIPSTVEKMKGIDWYLCLEADGILTFKHKTIVQKSDYLLAEMKSSEEFELTPDETTSLTARYNNVPFA